MLSIGDWYTITVHKLGLIYVQPQSDFNIKTNLLYYNALEITKFSFSVHASKIPKTKMHLFEIFLDLNT